MSPLDFTAAPFNGTIDGLLNPPRRLILKTGLSAAAATALGGISLPFGARLVQAAPSALRPYKVEWSEERLEALRSKIKAFQFPRPIQGSGWKYGVDPDYLHALRDYWANGFDMEGVAENLNRYPQFITRTAKNKKFNGNNRESFMGWRN